VCCGCFYENVGCLIDERLSLFRFQGQTRLYKSKPSDFRMALEEAMLAEDGVLESHLGRREEVTHADAHPDGLMEATGSYVDEECYGQDQVRLVFLFMFCHWMRELY